MLTEAAPQTARPALEVNASIVIQQVTETFVLTRPAGLDKQASELFLYV
jgi:hypothetical protein